MNLQMLKKAMLAYVSAVKFVWSGIAYPLSIVGKKLMNLRGYRVYGKSVQDGTPTPDNPVEIENVGDLTKNLFDTQGWYNWLRTFTTSYVQKKVVDGISCIYYRPALTYDKQYMLGEFKENTQYIIQWRAKGIVGQGESTGFVFNYTDGTRQVSAVKNEDKWDNYTLVSLPDKTLSWIDMGYNYGQGCYIDENSIQLKEGTTATDYEPYHKYKIPVVARGKNLFDGSSSEDNGKYLNNAGTLSSGNANLRVTDYITIPSGVSSLTFSFKGDTMYDPSLCLYNENKKYVTGIKYLSRTNVSISVPSNAKYVRCSYRTVNTDIQLEGSSTKTGYEPYIAPVTTNIFLDEPLRKVGDYADYVDFEKQKVVRNVYQYNLSEISALGSFNDKTTYWYGYWLLSGPYPISINKLKIISDKFKCIYPRNADVEDTYLSNDVPPYDSAMYYSVEKKYCPEVETIAEMLDWLRGTNADLFYVLATPTEEPINLPVLPQFKGTTIYEVGTNIKPSGMEAKYC